LNEGLGRQAVALALALALLIFSFFPFANCQLPTMPSGLVEKALALALAMALAGSDGFAHIVLFAFCQLAIANSLFCVLFAFCLLSIANCQLPTNFHFLGL
jgi:hypothetical protein